MSANILSTHSISRRQFLIRSGTASCGVVFALAGCGKENSSALGINGAATNLAANSWVTLYPDGGIEIRAPGIELGQGAATALPRLLAEELDADWSRVRVTPAPSEEKTYGNPMFWGIQITAGSRTMQGYFDVLRLAGAQARYILLTEAARRWRVPLRELHTASSTVTHGPSGKSVTYGELVPTAVVPKVLPDFAAPDDQPQLPDDFFGDPPPSPVAPDPKKSAAAIALKSRSQYRLIGVDTPRLDIPAKVSGAARYGIDTVLPGMLYAVVETGPTQGSLPETVDDTAARAVKDVVDVVRLPYGVAVIASSFPAAHSGRKRLKIAWKPQPSVSSYNSDAVLRDFARIAADPHGNPGVRVFEKGDPKAAAAALEHPPGVNKEGGPKSSYRIVTFEAHSEFIYHAPIEPQNATLRIAEDGKSAEAWVGTQWPKLDQDFVARVLGVQAEAIAVHTQYCGGSFGRRQEPGAIVDAAHIARAIRKPVKVIWTREDDLKRNPFRQALTCRVDAAVAPAGQILAIRHRIVSDSWFARMFTDWFEQYHKSDPGNWVGALGDYEIPLQIVDSVTERRGIDVCYMRGIGVSQTKFAQECLIDQVAAEHRTDPLEFRLRMLKSSTRGTRVLNAVAEMSDWKRARTGRALGLAFTPYSNSYAALVAEVSVDRNSGAVHVHEVWCALDAGLAVQPAMIAAQIEGGIMQGMSVALFEQVTIKEGAVQESNFHQYRILRMSEAPEVHVRVLSTANAVTGAAEIGVMQIAPAINNALARLLGRRLKKLPMLPADVLTALRA